MQNVNEVFPIEKLGFLFLLSGFAGLVYQVAWQRILFATLGGDIESVTIVVSAFMMGLGVGALVGGWMADAFPSKRLILFVLCEIATGVYGFASPWILSAGGGAVFSSPMPVIFLANFMLILFPTLFMGATLPVLVSYVGCIWRNIGGATGYLYGSNTLGAGLGAVSAGFVIFNWMTLSQSIYLAAFLNITAAVVTLWMLRKYT